MASPAKRPSTFVLQPVEEGGIAERAVFGDLGIARRQFAARQRLEQGRVGEDGDRLMEGADEILAVLRIDAGLAADRGIDLGEERGRDLDEADAAAEDCRGKTGQIADDTAAKGDDAVAALDRGGEQAVADLGELAEALGRLAGRKNDGGAV